MLLILPPSEGKRAPEAGARLDLDGLTRPELNDERRAVLDALIDLCTKQPAKAIDVLGLGPTQGGLVRANAGLRTAPVAPALEVYTGVLYEALDFASLRAPARRRADSRLLIASALFGFLSPSDCIPAYRLSGDCSLPRIGTLASAWKAPAQAALESTTGLLLDMRSGAYAALAPLTASLSERAVSVRVLVERNGRRSVVSHHNKATKGRLARAVLQSARVPGRIDSLESFIEGLGFTCELHDTRTGLVLDVIVTHV